VGPEYDTSSLGAYYSRASLFVYPSLAEKGETFGIAPLEAMAYGCAPLVSSLECFGDFIRDNENGFVFDHRSPNPEKALADRIETLLRRPETFAAAGLKAGETARRFSIEKVAGQYIDLFQSLLNP
jgi:glycosyltransferase involved in cell wall biosynthesis